MIFTALLTAYFLYEEVVSVRLYDRKRQTRENVTLFNNEWNYLYKLLSQADGLLVFPWYFEKPLPLVVLQLFWLNSENSK